MDHASVDHVLNPRFSTDRSMEITLLEAEILFVWKTCSGSDQNSDNEEQCSWSAYFTEQSDSALEISCSGIWSWTVHDNNFIEL